MPTIKLTCPSCGHDGTPATGRPPFGSYGFNYLSEGIVCREVWGYDHTGGIRLSANIDCVGTQETDAKIECRSCWRTFPVPVGLVRTLAPGGDVSEPGRRREAPRSPQPALEGQGAAIEAISRNLTVVLGGIRQEIDEINAVVRKLERLADGLHRADAVPGGL